VQKPLVWIAFGTLQKMGGGGRWQSLGPCFGRWEVPRFALPRPTTMPARLRLPLALLLALTVPPAWRP